MHGHTKRKKNKPPTLFNRLEGNLAPTMRKSASQISLTSLKHNVSIKTNVKHQCGSRNTCAGGMPCRTYSGSDEILITIFWNTSVTVRNKFSVFCFTAIMSSSNGRSAYCA